MTAFVSKDIAIKMNLLLYRILNVLADSYVRKVLFCSYFLIEHVFCISVNFLTNIQSICFFKVLNTDSD